MKILLKVLLGLIVVVIATLGLGTLLLNTNAVKDEIVARVAATTGLAITLDGDLGLSLFPAIEIAINDASIANAPGFGQEPFARVTQTRIRTKWSPLLERHLEIDRILVDGLMLNLIRDNQGSGNWQRLAHPRRDAAAPAGNPTITTSSIMTPAAIASAPRVSLVVYSETTADHPRRTLLERLSINAVQITGTTVKWTDHLSDARVVLSELAATSGRIATETPIAIKLNGKVIDAGSGLQTRFALDTVLTADREVRHLTLSPTELRLTELKTQQGLIAEAVLTAAVEADLAAKRYLANAMAARITAGGPALRGATVRGDLLANLTLDAAARTMELLGVSITSGALRLDGSLAAQQLFDAPVFTGQAAIAAFDLRDWLGQQGLPTLRTMDAAALTKVALQTDWQWAAGRLDLQKLDLMLDQTHITGWAVALPTKPAGYRFDLTADVLDLDRYLPPRHAGRTPTGPGQQLPSTGSLERDLRPLHTTAPPQPASIRLVRYGPAAPPVLLAAAAQPIAPSSPATPTSAAAPVTASLFPIELVRGLDLDGRIRIGELRAARLAFGGADLQISANNGQLRIDDRVERFYGGRINGHLGLSVQEHPPTLSLEQWAENFRTGALLKDITGDDVLTGRGKLNARLSATGQDEGSLRQSLGGEVRLDFADGVIKGFDLQQMIREAEARLTGKPKPPWRPAQTEYATLSASAVIREGVLHNDDLTGTSEYLHVSGQGRIDLANERLDYRLAPKLVDPPEGRGIKEIEDIPIPVRVTGSFQRPQWDIELGPILREAAQRGLGEDIQQKAGKLIQKLEESIGVKGLEQGLRNLFGF